MLEIDPIIPRPTAASGEALTVEEAGDRLFVAYYVYRAEGVAVLRFDGVRDWRRGSPNDETLFTHPLYAEGLDPYRFHVMPGADPEERVWVGTFHDETLTVTAGSVHVLAARDTRAPDEALARLRDQS